MPHPEIEQNVQELIFPVENLPEQEPQNFEGKLGLSQCPRLRELAEDSELELEYQFSLKRESRKVLIDGEFKGQFKLNCDRCLGTIKKKKKKSEKQTPELLSNRELVCRPTPENKKY